MSSGRLAVVLCSGIVLGGLIGFQVQTYFLEQARRKESAFIETEVERKYRERKQQPAKN
jgi:hypothetical protein